MNNNDAKITPPAAETTATPTPEAAARSCGERTAYAIFTSLITFLVVGGYGVVEALSSGVSFWLWAFLFTAAIAVTAAIMAPSWIALCCCRPLNAPDLTPRQRRWRNLPWLIAGFLTGSVWCLLATDIGIYQHFGFHFNGLVLNLLTTRGGFEAMGLDATNIIVMGFGLTLILALGMLCAWYFGHGALPKRVGNWCSRRRLSAIGMAVVLFSAVSYTLTIGIAEFYQNMLIMNAIDAYPVAVRVRMRSLLKKLGCQRTNDHAANRKMHQLAGSELKYPLRPIKREETKRPNIVWLVAESLRNDMLSKTIMPRTWSFVNNRGIRFANHYSGGNGTRPAMFSMFYGLYGSAWEPFLDHKRGALFFDWLLEDDYQLLIQTSAKFTYPEFDQTIFAALPPEVMHEESGVPPWERDINCTQRLVEFIRKRPTDKPFFGFIFYESTHAPYSFDESQPAQFMPYQQDLNYANIGPEDRLPLYNRAANAAYHVDGQIALVIQELEQSGLLDNTILIITGDHGEEFYEHGRLGHNSSFVDEQIKPPLAMYLPDHHPGIYEKMSHHTDIVPTIAPYLGVRNPPVDYSVGGDLLNDDYHRIDYIVCGWQTAVFGNANGKLLLPLNTKSIYAKNRLLDANDNPAKNIQDFYSRNASEIFNAQKEIRHCLGN